MLMAQLSIGSFIMPHYVDFFVVPVPKKKVDAYKAHAKRWAKIWKKMGALDYVECIADDVKPGKLTSFPQAVMQKKNETIAAAYVVFKSKAHRDKLWKQMMKNPELANMDMSTMPFDGARMFFGGFKQIA
jgi:uncharacterized protein YbaA (DUF1428 family)